jgi:predicted nucleic acid-binding protein
MNVLVDTSVWSLALRRTKSVHPVTERLRELILEGRASIIGPIRQELLSGVKIDVQFDKLKQKLRAFPDIELMTDDHEEAGRFFNLCRAKGVQGSNTDFLICAVAARRKLSIFSTDRDFELFARHVPVSLYGA